MKITIKKPTEIHKNPNNPRKNEKAVDKLRASIEQFGIKQPLVIDNDGMILAGNTRYEAIKQLGIKEIPCVIASDLTEEQQRAYALADNKVAEFSEWDDDLLPQQLLELEAYDIDMTVFGFELPNDEIDEPEDDGYYGDERERTIDAYNMNIASYVEHTNDFWQMPIIKATDFVPDDLIGFNYAKTSPNKNTGIHFYVDDYQFERIWNRPSEYTGTLSEYECILTPDFSLYMSMDRPTKLWNVYRSKLIGAYYQSEGLTVIPTLQWAEKETFDFAFKGIEQGGTVSVSTIGVKDNENALQIWRDGMQEAIKQIQPSTILVYGGKLDFDYGDIKVVYYENQVTKRWKENSGV